MKSAADDDGRVRHRYDSDPPSRAAREGRRLPPPEKPLPGMLFRGNELVPDAQGSAALVTAIARVQTRPSRSIAAASGRSPAQ
jgi:hypothetical protein